MRKIISFMHISLDGFVAGPNGEMDWITVDEAIFDRVALKINNCDTAMYGRVTYQMMESYWPTAADQPNAGKHDIEHSAWYRKVHKIVLSNTLKIQDSANLTIISNNLVERINEIKQKSGPEIAVFGSPGATHSLLQHNLIDGFWLFVNPVVLGQGIPLFSNIEEKMNLKLLDTHRFSNGVVELSYIKVD